MTEYSDILIVGGGISGLLTARELSMAGLSVTILEKSAIGRESSWAGGGILLPIYPWRQPPAISDLVMDSLRRYPDLSHQLLEASGIDPEWTACGMLICKNPDLAQAEAWCLERGVRHQKPDAQLMSFATDYIDPLWLPDIAQARNPRLIKSLKAFLENRGVRLIEHCDILTIENTARRINAVNTRDHRYTFEQLIVCTGAWTKHLLSDYLPASKWTPAIQPVRGQMLLFDAQPDTLRHMILDGDHYLIPRRDGKILAGSTVEHTGFEKITTEHAKTALYRFATTLLPELKHYPVCAHWAGLRPGTPDGVPYIGFHPDIDNLSVNAGHFRNGLVMGPASARLMADLILQRPTSVNPSPYALTH